MIDADTSKEAAQTINLADLAAKASGLSEGVPADVVQEEKLSVVDEIVETKLAQTSEEATEVASQPKAMPTVATVIMPQPVSLALMQDAQANDINRLASLMTST